MFRTVQNSASTITLFHNSRSKLSESLYHLLDKVANDSSSKVADRIYFDIAANQMPTYDQFSTIASNVPTDDTYQQGVLRAAFPLLSDKTGPCTLDPKKKISVKGASMFNEGEYKLIHEAFNKAQENPELPDQASELFNAPLVVDWDKASIANDEEGLKRLLKEYE
ncbi:hypothetical protein DICA3_D05512 [Diutina catenulata]